MTTELHVTDSGRYPVCETARILGIHRNTLRRYTERGLIKCGIRRGTNQRFYLGSEIRRFWSAMA